jgi:hypothetical protein
VLDAMQRRMTDDPEADRVSSEHILGALAAGAFAPSLEWVVEPLCEGVLVACQEHSSPPRIS